MRRVLLDVAIERINNISCGRCSVPTKSSVAWIICLLSAPALILFTLWLVFMLLLPLGCALLGFLSWRKLMMMQATEQATSPTTAIHVVQAPAIASEEHLNVQLYDPGSINGRSIREGNMLQTLFTLSCNSGLIRIVFSVLVFSQLSRFLSWVEHKTMIQQDEQQQHRYQSVGSSNSYGGYEFVADNESGLSDQCDSSTDSELSSILSTEDGIGNGGSFCDRNGQKLEIKSQTVFWFNPLANVYYTSGHSSEVASDSDTDHEGEIGLSAISINRLTDAAEIKVNQVISNISAKTDELNELENINEAIRRYWHSLQSVSAEDYDTELDLQRYHGDSKINYELDEEVEQLYVHNILESNTNSSLQVDPDLDMDIDYELFVYAGGIKPCNRSAPTELDLSDQWRLTENSSSVHINIDGDQYADCCGRLSDYNKNDINYNYGTASTSSPSPAFTATEQSSCGSSSSTDRASSSTSTTPSLSSSWDNWSWIQWHRNNAMFGKSAATNVRYKYCSDDDSSACSPTNYSTNPPGRQMINANHTTSSPSVQMISANHNNNSPSRKMISSNYSLNSPSRQMISSNYSLNSPSRQMISANYRSPKQRKSPLMNNQWNRGLRRDSLVNNNSNNSARRSKAAVSKSSCSNSGGALQKVQAQRRQTSTTLPCRPPPPSPVFSSGRTSGGGGSGRISIVPERHLRRLHVPASTTSRSSAS